MNHIKHFNNNNKINFLSHLDKISKMFMERKTQMKLTKSFLILFYKDNFSLVAAMVKSNKENSPYLAPVVRIRML